MNALLTRNFKAGAAISPYRFVKAGAADYEVLQNAAATTEALGASNQLGAAAAGDPVDVVMAGIAEIELGEYVTRNAKLTSDANGKGVAAAAGNQSAGIALASGAAGAIIEVLLTPGGLK